MGFPTAEEMERRISGKPKGRGGKRSGGKLSVRYDPETGERLMLSRSDPRFDETVTPAQWKRQNATGKKVLKERESTPPSKGGSFLEDLAKDVTKDVIGELRKKGPKKSAAQRRAQEAANAAAMDTLLTIGKTPVGTLVKSGGALAIGSTAALAILAGVGSYYATTWIMNKLAEARDARTPDAIRNKAAMAYRQARLDAEEKLKRPLSKSEHQYLAAQFKAKLATIPPR